MKKKITVLTLTLTLALGVMAVAGCTSSAAEEEEVVSDGAPAMIPADHAGRYEEDGAWGCFICHGESDYGNPAMVTAVAMPNDHYVDGDSHTQELDPVREQCITCHVQS